MRCPQMLLTGDVDHPDFADCRRTLLADGANMLPELDRTSSWLAHSAVAPDWLIVAQAAPGSVPASAVEQLRRVAPLARIIVVLGSWCEGETRSGQPIPGAARVFWHQWPARYAREVELFAAGRGAWQLPATATEDDRAQANVRLPWPTGNGLVLIVASHRDAMQPLANICQAAGYQCEWWRDSSAMISAAPLAVLVDSRHGSDEEVTMLQSIAQRWPRAVLIVLPGFPRMEDTGRWTDAGATAVLSKPFVVDDLLSLLPG